ncbi:conserved hypothetical protein [Nostocoides japonicum T1-X7]|uniref:Uncharacterized protein n=1 Tax=Nostocoides japonicum T1-X7 TaxID=1194083 RepID=A0A077M4J2_9MICO|nr:AAA family ATPase [Tetrasphaera japonica]CCH80022.1 conserved hypothetical protein [Tetrasphaera japonica T1-X7]
MRIVVSGTHGTGKSTLVADFASHHAEYATLGDPFELVDAALEQPDSGAYYLQLEIAAARLLEASVDADLIAERGPVDFLAYLTALHTLGRSRSSGVVDPWAWSLATQAMRSVDLLVVLPLDSTIWLSPEEDLELRDAMNDALLDLIDDAEIISAHTRVEELSGTESARLARLDLVVQTMSATR